MNLKRKLEMADQSIASIAGHVDEDGAVRVAALEKLIASAEAAKAQIAAQVKADIESALT